ncbi:hypothetical protein [Halomontanus rarus]|uniref:hypothetical protein n=1 Tax=Halomontanus rarus TaxID=3034020 RepID=UPI00307BDE4A
MNADLEVIGHRRKWDRRKGTTVHELDYDKPLIESEIQFEADLPQFAADMGRKKEDVVLELPNHDTIPIQDLGYEVEKNTLRVWHKPDARRGTAQQLFDRLCSYLPW